MRCTLNVHNVRHRSNLLSALYSTGQSFRGMCNVHPYKRGRLLLFFRSGPVAYLVVNYGISAPTQKHRAAKVLEHGFKSSFARFIIHRIYSSICGLPVCWCLRGQPGNGQRRPQNAGQDKRAICIWLHVHEPTRASCTHTNQLWFNVKAESVCRMNLRGIGHWNE